MKNLSVGCTLLIALVLGTFDIYAQDEEEFNVQALTPSALLRVGQYEFKSFNNLYSQTSIFDNDGQRTPIPGRPLFNDDGSVKENPDGIRETFLTSTNQFTYGLSQTVNVGLDIWINSGITTNDATSKFKIFKFEQSANSRTALSYIGPRVKFVPISDISNFSVQTILLIPIASNLQGVNTPQPFLNWDSYVWATQFFLDVTLNSKVLVFLNVDFIWSINRNSEVASFQSNRVSLPAKAFLNYFATDRLTLQFQNELNPIFQSYGPTTDRSSNGTYYYQLGAAIKFQLIPGTLEIEASNTYFLVGKNQGAGNTLNFGLRAILGK